jgi:hypothetical protein
LLAARFVYYFWPDARRLILTKKKALTLAKSIAALLDFVVLQMTLVFRYKLEKRLVAGQLLLFGDIFGTRRKHCYCT